MYFQYVFLSSDCELLSNDIQKYLNILTVDLKSVLDTYLTIFTLFFKIKPKIERDKTDYLVIRGFYSTLNLMDLTSLGQTSGLTNSATFPLFFARFHNGNTISFLS